MIVTPNGAGQDSNKVVQMRPPQQSNWRGYIDGCELWHFSRLTQANSSVCCLINDKEKVKQNPTACKQTTTNVFIGIYLVVFCPWTGICACSFCMRRSTVSRVRFTSALYKSSILFFTHSHTCMHSDGSSSACTKHRHTQAHKLGAEHSPKQQNYKIK